MSGHNVNTNHQHGGDIETEGSQPIKSNSGVSSANVDMKYLIRALIKYSASDLHLKAERPPLYRINGKLVPLKIPAFTEVQVRAVVYSILSSKQIADFERYRQINMSFSLANMGRFRCNVFFQRGSVAAAIRMIPLAVPVLMELGVPQVIKELCQRPRGLILVTGATGSGKSTTLAAMINYINDSQQVHILTIEDPIEFIHRDVKASVTQREVGVDTPSLYEGLLAGLRQDPDVIMIGELLDRNMIQTALTAAETGHLVLATLHTNDAKSTISRILDVFPP
ncbi:MAG: PilT/PilU family type 4a pilus ATPase, partial [Candidatus Poribacteria bacterium]